jgi:NadR type nicotinamide-nucleotide adenylyltransferase
MTTGVVVGKFYPPHRGHRFLIETAAAEVDELDVILCWREDQTIPGEIREAWLHEMVADLPNVRVRSVWDFGDDANSEAWAKYTIEVLGRAPDIAFTSETYGDAFADCLGARHRCVDLERKTVSISGSAIRSDPSSHWELLEPSVRAWFATRIAIVGAESTGTTTLAQALAERYETTWVPEYGREYCEKLTADGSEIDSHVWTTDEFVHIATVQQEREDVAARSCNRLLFCDTDALATSIWHERYMGCVSEAVRRISASRRYALYVLTDVEIPFVQDGLRDGEYLRAWMTRRFEDELDAIKANWVLARGSLEERLRGVGDTLARMTQAT